VYPLRRRWFTTHFLQPDADPQHPDDIVPIPLSLWNEFDDTFEHADQAILDDLAQWTGIPPAEFAPKLRRRIEYLRKASKGHGLDNGQMYDAIDEVRQCEKKSLPSNRSTNLSVATVSKTTKGDFKCSYVSSKESKGG